MKCPLCNFERSEPFKFCPKCGNPAQIKETAPVSVIEPISQPEAVEEIKYETQIEEQVQEKTEPLAEKVIAPQTVQENQTKPQIRTFVRRIPYGFTENTYIERKGIRKLSRISGGAFLTLSFFSGIIAYFVLFGLMAFGFTYEEVLELFEDPYFLQYFQITASTFMFIVPFTLFFKFSGHKLSKIIDFSLPKTKAWFPIVLMGIGFCAFANIAGSIAASFFEGFGINYEVDFGENPKGVVGFLLSFLATAIVPAFVEEFACRGVVMGALKKYGEGFAIMVSSILFGFIHGNFQQIPFAFLVGLILGFVTIKCGSIWPAILIHFYNNFTSVVFDYIFTDMDMQLQNVIYTVYLSVCLLIGLIGLVLLKDSETFKLNNGGTEASEKQKYKWFFTTETTVFVIVICLLESLQYFVL